MKTNRKTNCPQNLLVFVICDLLQLYMILMTVGCIEVSPVRGIQTTTRGKGAGGIVK